MTGQTTRRLDDPGAAEQTAAPAAPAGATTAVLAPPLPTGPAAAGTRSRPGPARLLVLAGERNALLLLLVVVVVIFSVWSTTSETFPTAGNARLLIGAQSVVALMSIALIFPLLVGEFDFSIGYLVSFIAMFNASAMSRFDLPFAAAAVLSVLVAALIGAITGYAVAKLKLNSLIVTIATGTLMSGLVQWYSGGLSISSGISQTLIDFGSKTWLGIPRTAYLLVLVIAVTWQVLERTPVGRYLRFIGSSRESAYLVGVNVDRYIWSTFIASSVLGAVAALLLTGINGAANPGDGPGLLFAAISAAFLGATTVRPGEFNILGTIVGVFFVGASVSGLNLAGVQPWVQPIFYGTSLAVAVALSTVLIRRRQNAAA